MRWPKAWIRARARIRKRRRKRAPRRTSRKRLSTSRNRFFQFTRRRLQGKRKSLEPLVLSGKFMHGGERKMVNAEC